MELRFSIQRTNRAGIDSVLSARAFSIGLRRLPCGGGDRLRRDDQFIEPHITRRVVCAHFLGRHVRQKRDRIVVGGIVVLIEDEVRHVDPFFQRLALGPYPRLYVAVWFAPTPDGNAVVKSQPHISGIKEAIFRIKLRIPAIVAALLELAGRIPFVSGHASSTTLRIHHGKTVCSVPAVPPGRYFDARASRPLAVKD